MKCNDCEVFCVNFESAGCYLILVQIPLIELSNKKPFHCQFGSLMVVLPFPMKRFEDFQRTMYNNHETTFNHGCSDISSNSCWSVKHAFFYVTYSLIDWVSSGNKALILCIWDESLQSKYNYASILKGTI